MTVLDVCPTCGAFARARVVFVEARNLDPVPRQVELYVERASWQCLRDESHHGERRTPSDYRVASPEEA